MTPSGGWLCSSKEFSPCGWAGSTCRQVTRAHWSLVWAPGAGVNLVAHRVPSHCECLNIGTSSFGTPRDRVAFQSDGQPPPKIPELRAAGVSGLGVEELQQRQQQQQQQQELPALDPEPWSQQVAAPLNRHQLLQVRQLLQPQQQQQLRPSTFDPASGREQGLFAPFVSIEQGSTADTTGRGNHPTVSPPAARYPLERHPFEANKGDDPVASSSSSSTAARGSVSGENQPREGTNGAFLRQHERFSPLAKELDKRREEQAGHGVKRPSPGGGRDPRVAVPASDSLARQPAVAARSPPHHPGLTVITAEAPGPEVFPTVTEVGGSASVSALLASASPSSSSPPPSSA